MIRLRGWVRSAGWPGRIALVSLVRLYRLTLGGVIGGGCRFHPSCSEYAEQAIGELGVLRGVGLTVWRVLRCSPLSRGGVDYPPKRAPVNEAVIQIADRDGRTAMPA
jgi:putative membrane protein insertion efficiency factor